MENTVKFEAFGFSKRLKSMLRVDLKRMFKSKLFYIILQFLTPHIFSDGIIINRTAVDTSYRTVRLYNITDTACKKIHTSRNYGKTAALTFKIFYRFKIVL